MSNFKLVSERIQDFIDWLEVQTPFGTWDADERMRIHKALILFMVSDKITLEDLDAICKT